MTSAEADVDALEASANTVNAMAAVYVWLESEHLERTPQTVLSEDASAAIRTTRQALQSATPSSLRRARQQRATDAAAAAEEVTRSVDGVVVRT